METRSIATDLQNTLVELTDLALTAKQAHWNLTGPLFLTLHAQLDELADTLRDEADQVAERAVALGHAPDARAGTVADASPLPAFAAGEIPDRAVLAHIVSSLDQVIGSLLARLRRLEEADPLSHDLLVGVARTLEEQR